MDSGSISPTAVSRLAGAVDLDQSVAGRLWVGVDGDEPFGSVYC